MDVYKLYGGDGGIKEYSPWHGFSLGDIFNPQSALNTQIAANNARVAQNVAQAQAAQWAAVQAKVSIPNGQALAAQARANLANQQNNSVPYGYSQPGNSAPSAGYAIDPNTGYYIDPNTGYDINPQSGLDINPQTGQDIPAGYSQPGYTQPGYYPPTTGYSAPAPYPAGYAPAPPPNYYPTY